MSRTIFVPKSQSSSCNGAWSNLRQVGSLQLNRGCIEIKQGHVYHVVTLVVMFQEPREAAVYFILVFKAFVTAPTLHVIAMVCD